MNSLSRKEKNIIVIGHKNPDTDSICSAIAYADLKRRTEGPGFEAFRAGEINRETAYVLNRFSMEPPKLCHDVYAEVQDLEIRPVEGVPADTSVRRAWEIMRDMEARTQPVIAEDGTLLGLCTLGDLAKANMDSLDPAFISKARTPFENILSVLEGTVICGHPPEYLSTVKVVVGAASPEILETKVDKGDIVIIGNRYEAQLCAIEMGASLIIVCNGTRIAKTIRKLATENNCTMILTHYDTFAASILIQQSVPVNIHMTPADNLLKFLPTEPIEDVEEVMKSVRHRYFPICNTKGKYLGLISRRNLLNLQRKQLILIDHNEQSQCVNGWEDAEVLEIVDHHRIGSVQTIDPIRFTNRVVGSTATIIYHFYKVHGEVPSPQIAGLLLSAILSDTLVFRSPTCMPVDREMAGELAKIADVDMDQLAQEMFEAGEDLSGETAEDVFFADFKKFSQGGVEFGVGQGSFMSAMNLNAAKDLL